MDAYRTVIEGVPVESYGITGVEELTDYFRRAHKKYGAKLKGLKVVLEENGEVTLTYDVGYQPFQRIRRITGYLVGGLNRWNNAKRAEETDRVKHGG